MDHKVEKVETAAGRLKAAAELGLLSHREEILVLLNHQESNRKDSARQFREYHSLKSAFDILEGVVTDQSSRIKALEDSIRGYLDPSRSRSGVDELQTVLEQELGYDPPGL